MMRRTLFTLLLLLGCCSVNAHEWDGVERVVAIGDIHGAHEAVTGILQAAGLVDEALRWSGGTTHLVSVGDLIDRGEGSRAVLDLFMRLQGEAQAAGGRVHVLLGNHEVMNLTRDLRDVSPAEMASYGGLEGHAELFAQDGLYGEWLLGLPVMIRIDDTVFVHAGLAGPAAGMSVAGINRDFSAALLTSVETAINEPLTEEGAEPVPVEVHALLDANGPLWYRGNATCHALLERNRITGILDRLGVTRVVQGHTPTSDRTVHTRFDGRVVAIDTGMLASVYRGIPYAVEILGDDLKVIDRNGVAVPLGKVEPEDNAWEFIEAGSRLARREVAAYRLDRLLGLGIVPPTRLAEVDGDSGIEYRAGRSFSERVRLERGISRSNPCEVGSDFDLLAAFDSLTGMRSRNVDNLAYAIPTLELRVAGFGEAFPTSSALGEYTYQPQLATALAERLIMLDEAKLTSELGELLSGRQIRAILKRRDKLLEWPRLPE